MPPTDRRRSINVEVLIPNWNRRELLRSALTGLDRQTEPAAVCVIDNGSSDGSVHMASSEFPETRVIELEENHGFGGALNRGVAESDADVVVFLNNDTVPDREFVARLVDSASSGVEMVAACLRRPDGRVDSLGVEVDQSLIAYDLAHGEPYGEAEHRLLQPLAPTGGAAAFRRDAFLGVGGFDEEIFAYLEDVDLGLRMRMEGARCSLAYDAWAWHRHAGTLGGGSKAKNRLLAGSRGYLLWKYGRNLSSHQRARGASIDLVVYLGQALIDRNLGSFAGRLGSRRRLSARRAADPDRRFGSLPLQTIGVGEALRRRIGRRQDANRPGG